MPPNRIELIPFVGLRSWRKISSVVGSHCCCKNNKKIDMQLLIWIMEE
jgi:hypothetical protein